MDHSATQLVNSLLVDVHRSLLQYAAEASSWTSAADAETLERLLALSTEQRQSVAEMVIFLQQRKQRIDFGVYPNEYTSLHFVALSYLLDRVKDSQQELVSELTASVEQFAGDQAAQELVTGVLQREQQILQGLHACQQSAATP